MDNPRIIAAGDLHGSNGVITDMLYYLDIIDGEGNWIARETDFVQMGDICDRGWDSFSIYKNMMKWQEQAKDLGSGVYMLLGNHEVMNLFGLSGYPTSEEMSGYSGKTVSGPQAFKEAFGAGGWLRKWLLKQRVVLQLGSIVFAHADLPENYSDMSINDIEHQTRDALFSALSGDRPLRDLDLPLFGQEESIFWARSASYFRKKNYRTYHNRFLQKNNASLYVCGHTPVENGGFRILYRGSYICIDSAMGFLSRGVGVPSLLVIEDQRAFGHFFYKDDVQTKELELAV
ncbi:MAG: metallophosphoesterase [Spirochaetia bacterium]